MRSTEQRVADTLRRLNTDANVWVASAVDGRPHLVPLSLAWDGERLLVATPADTPTARNLSASGQAKVTLDSADDVVLIEADATVASFDESDETTVGAYIDRVGWDPRNEPGTWVLIALTPSVTRAWNGVREINGRTIMRDGAWLD